MIPGTLTRADIAQARAEARAEAREVAVEREAAADGSQRQGDAS